MKPQRIFTSLDLSICDLCTVMMPYALNRCQPILQRRYAATGPLPDQTGGVGFDSQYQCLNNSKVGDWRETPGWTIAEIVKYS